MRKNFIWSLIAFILIFSILGSTAFAESATVTGTAVNLRSGPGTGYRILDTLAAGAVVEVVDRSYGSWYEVSYNGQRGYMSANYLSMGDSYTATVVPTYSAPAEEGSAVIMFDGIQPASGSDWAGSSATVYSDPVVPAAAPVVTTAPIVTAAPAASQPSNDGSAVIILPDGSSLSSSPAASAPVSAAPAADASRIGKRAMINTDFVCLRSGPSSSYGIITKYNKGKEVTISGAEVGGWTPCTVDNRDGYVYTQYLSLRDAAVADALTFGSTVQTPSAAAPAPAASPAAPAASASGNAYITGNNVRFRSGPSMSSEILGEFFYGNTVTVTGTSGDWTAVTYNGKSGYVYSSYVKVGSYTQAYPAANQITTTAPSTTTPGTTAGSVTPPTVSGNVTGQQIANFALQFVGYRYTWGGKAPETGFDCSGFVYYVYSQFGYTLNRVACDQALNGVHVDPQDLQPGDVLCFYSNDNYYIGHTGIYIGNNKFIHASTSTTGVIITELGGYYFTRGYEARRIL